MAIDPETRTEMSEINVVNLLKLTICFINMFW